MALITDFEPLTPAEEKLLTGLASGKAVVIGDGRLPAEDAGGDREIRGAFLRDVILDAFDDLATWGDGGARVHEKGVQLVGARISGVLDLEGGRAPRDVALFDCRFEAAPVLQSTCIDNLFLEGSVLPGLEADRLEAKGDVFLRDVTATGAVRLPGATLGGNLDCRGARFKGAGDGAALMADGLEAKGGVVLHDVTASGEVRLPGAKLGGNLDCTGARFTGKGDGAALMADGLEAKGGVFLRDVTAVGAVRLLGAKLGGALDCTGARFTGPGDDGALIADRLEAKGSVFLRDVTAVGAVRLHGAKLGGNLELTESHFESGAGAFAINLNGASVAGALFLRGGTQVDGVLDLIGATVGVLLDTPKSWPDRGNLKLDRFTYGAITGGAPVDAASRIDWLDRQGPVRNGKDFWPQPWEQCAKVLREMGHRDDARKVLIAKEKRQRAARQVKLKRELLFEDAMWHRLWDTVLGGTVRYGHVPLLAVAWLAGFLLLGTLVFDAAAERDAIKPNSSRMFRAAEWAECHPDYEPAPGETQRNTGTSQLDCFLVQPEAVSYPGFSSLIYSADTLLPIVDLEMQGYWIPDDKAESGWGVWARRVLWLQIFAGWALSLLAVAGFSGLIRTDSK